jgi:hypothetical protein
MSFAAEHKALESAFQAGWAASVATYPAAYGNVPFTPPASSPWVRFSVLSGEGNRASLGTASPLHRFTGLLVLQIFVPRDSGERTARTIADLFDPIFRDQQLDTDSGGVITCRTPSFVAVGETDAQAEGDNWLQFNVTVAFDRDEVL